ncbi:MAG: response regulator [bacterium]
MAKKIPVTEILICDDSFETRMLLKTILTKEGFTVTEATDGIMAQELAAARQPDLIIMDLVMPRQDGLTTLKKLKSDPETQDIPVIIISGKSAVTGVLEENKKLISAILEKPFHVKDIKQKVAEILNV